MAVATSKPWDSATRRMNSQMLCSSSMTRSRFLPAGFAAAALPSISLTCPDSARGRKSIVVVRVLGASDSTVLSRCRSPIRRAGCIQIIRRHGNGGFDDLRHTLVERAGLDNLVHYESRLIAGEQQLSALLQPLDQPREDRFAQLKPAFRRGQAGYFLVTLPGETPLPRDRRCRGASLRTRRESPCGDQRVCRTSRLAAFTSGPGPIRRIGIRNRRWTQNNNTARISRKPTCKCVSLAIAVVRMGAQ